MHLRDRVRDRGGSSENTTRRIPPVRVRAVEPQRRVHFQRADPAPRRAESAIIVCNRRYVVVRVEEVEAAWDEYYAVKESLDNMLRDERNAVIRFAQVKGQLGRAGMRFDPGFLPFRETPPPPPPPYQPRLDREIFIVGVDQSRRRMSEATVPVAVDKLRAALIRLRITESDLDKSSYKERELRINIAQGEDQLRRAGITPCQSQGLLPSTSSSTSRRIHRNG